MKEKNTIISIYSVAVLFLFLIAFYSIPLVTQDTLSLSVRQLLLYFIRPHSEVSTPKYTEIIFTGDIMLARNVERLSRALGADFPYRKLTRFSSSSVLVGNFEASIPEVHIPAPSGTFAFSVDPLFLPALRHFGFQYVSLANNHSYDYGVKGYLNAQSELTGAGITHFGDQKSQASSTIAFVQLEDAVVALVGLYALDTRPSYDELVKLLSRAKMESDIQIVYVHWGTEYALVHNTFQESLAHDIVDLGADAVIGHHPHVVQDVEFYNNVPIFYSLGNFIFDQYFSKEVQEGLIVRFTSNAQGHLFTLEGVTAKESRSQPRFMTASEKPVFLRELAKRSAPELREMIEKGLLELTQ